MSRLESMRRRLTAQIDGINWATNQIKAVDGDVLELGLGNGRSFDHLRQEIKGRRIWVIDRILECHPSCIPPVVDFLCGEAEDMLGNMASNHTRIALAHYDFGFGVKDLDVQEGVKLSPSIASVMVPGGLVLSQQPLVGFNQISGPDTIDPERYFFYRSI
jgi:hypothetical protein